MMKKERGLDSTRLEKGTKTSKPTARTSKKGATAAHKEEKKMAAQAGAKKSPRSGRKVEKRGNNTQATFIKSALDNVGTHVLMCDRDLTVTYMNEASKKTLTALEAEIRKVMPGFAVDRIVGTNIDTFHKDPSYQRGLLADPSNLPRIADIQLGSATLNLKVRAVLSDAGEYLGNVVEWEDVTAKRKMAVEMARLKSSLDNASANVIVADRDYNIVYVNNASVKALREVEYEIQKVMPAFRVDKVVGSNIDMYHKNPAHQRRLLDDPKNLPYRAEIEIGPLKLDLNVSAVMSDSGEYVGNVVEWVDATAQRKAQSEVERMIHAAAEGQLSERIDVAEFKGFLRVLSEGINNMLDTVVTPLHEAQEVLGALAQGNLTKEMSGDYRGEFDQMKKSLNSAVENLTGVITRTRDVASQVASGASEISRGNDDLSSRTAEQASALEETSSSMEEMTSTVKQNADNAKQANQLGIAARETAEKGGAVVAQTVAAMSEINKSSKKIADIITVIDEIAFQTNLLALNAAVEAARAGEQGRGFAVVAAEVRNLAGRSAGAAKEIKGLINESVQRVTEGTDLVNKSGQSLEEIVGSVKRVTDILGEISAASQEQSTGIEQVNKAVMEMDQTTQQNSALVEEATSASQNLATLAQELMSQVKFFTVEHAEETGDYVSAHQPSPTRTSIKPAVKPKGVERQLAAVGASTSGGSNGHKHTDEEFEEF